MYQIKHASYTLFILGTIFVDNENQRTITVSLFMVAVFYRIQMKNIDFKQNEFHNSVDMDTWYLHDILSLTGCQQQSLHAKMPGPLNEDIHYYYLYTCSFQKVFP